VIRPPGRSSRGKPAKLLDQALAGGAVAREEVPHAGLGDAEIDRTDVRHGEALAAQIIGQPLGQRAVSLIRDVMNKNANFACRQRWVFLCRSSLAGHLDLGRRAQVRRVVRDLRRRSTGLHRLYARFLHAGRRAAHCRGRRSC
jgi:hypothetical protein